MKRRALTALLTIFLVVSSAYIWQALGHPHPLLTSTLFLIAPGLAVISGLYAINTYKLPTGSGQVMTYLTLGLGCWFIGEVIFYLFQFVFDMDPYPSLADAFYIAAYPLIFVALIKEIKAHNFRWQQLNKMTLYTGGLLALALAYIVGYFGIYLAYKSGEPLLNNLVAMGYGVGDLILLIPTFFILKVASDFRGGKLFTSWMVLFTALLCIMVGDVLFAIFTDQYEALRPAAGLIDLAWTTGYLLFAYGLFYKSATVIELRSTLLKKHRQKSSRA